jgi:hypothetical protein
MPSGGVPPRGSQLSWCQSWNIRSTLIQSSSKCSGQIQPVRSFSPGKRLMRLSQLLWLHLGMLAKSIWLEGMNSVYIYVCVCVVAEGEKARIG